MTAKISKTIFITSTGSGVFTVPSDFGLLVSVEAIGCGGDGGTGGGAGGGGAYAKSTSVGPLKPSQPVYIQVGPSGQGGSAGGVSWFNVVSNAKPTTSTQGVAAAPGSNSTGTTGGAGGTVANSVGDVTYAGGDGGTRLGAGNFSGGGGAAGPNGAGWNGGGVAPSGSFNGGGGGAGGGSGSAGVDGNSIKNGNGGNGPLGTGGGISNGGAGTAGTGGGGAATNGASSVGGSGATYNYWTQTSNSATAGPGGGGGGTNGASSTGGAGGLYGGGGGGAQTTGGAGAQGIIVFTYYIDTYSPSGYKFPILNSDGTASSTVVDFDDMFVQKELFLDAGLYAWGFNSSGALGNGNTTNYSSPIQVGSLTNWKQVENGYFSSLAIKTDGSLWSWGTNTSGQLGDSTIVSKSSPIQIGALYNWKQVSVCGDAAVSTSAAIKTDGTLWTWGSNHLGQMGINSSGNYYSSPVQVGSLTDWKQVSTGFNHIAAIKTDGTLWAWGSNYAGQLGIDNIAYYSSPVQIGSLTNWKQVSASSIGHMIALKTNGTLWAWGQNHRGQLGISAIGFTTGAPGYYSSPIQVGSLTSWKQVSVGQTTSAAIKTDGTLWTWGGGSSGQLGNNASTYYSSPIQVGSLTNWKQVSVRFLNTSAIKTDGTLWVWGDNSNGQLGQGYITNTYSSPIQVGSLTSWKQTTTGYATTAISSPDLP